VSTSDISLASIGTDAGIPNLNVADIPANIQNGNNQAKQAYSEGLAFESVLVNELSQQMANTMYGGGGIDGSSSGDGIDGSDSSDGGDSSDSSGLLSGASAYSSLIPQALTSSIMSSGGLGIAEEFAQELDPSLLSQASSGAGATDTTGSSSADASETPTETGASQVAL
jgi:Rod binding domain-containing protein